MSPSTPHDITAEMVANVLQVLVEPGARVEAGDTVVILPSYYVGSIDFAETPVGRIPVSFVHVSLINSALTGEWLGRLPAGTALIEIYELP